MFKIFKTAVLWQLAICLAATVMVLSPSSTMGEQTGNVKVTVLVFSGRPNPVFLIEENQLLGKIKSNLDNASPNAAFKRGTVIPGRLGYNGLIVEGPGNKAGFPATIKVYKNDIELQNEQVRFLIDDGSMEKFLLQQAMEKKAINQQILDFIRSDK